MTEEESVAPAEPAEPEVEVFYTFKWAGFRKRAEQTERRPRKDRPQGQGKRGPKGKGKGGGKPKNFEARPPKKDKPIDPNNPFAAALSGLKIKD